MEDNQNDNQEVVGNDEIQQGSNSEQSLMGGNDGSGKVEQSDTRSFNELRKRAKELGVVVKQGTSKEALLKMVQDAEADPEAQPQPQEQSEAQVVEEGFVQFESADGRLLRAQINGRVYEGKTIKVPEENAEGVRETLVARGFVLK